MAEAGKKSRKRALKVTVQTPTQEDANAASLFLQDTGLRKKMVYNHQTHGNDETSNNAEKDSRNKPLDRCEPRVASVKTVARTMQDVGLERGKRVMS